MDLDLSIRDPRDSIGGSREPRERSRLLSPGEELRRVERCCRLADLDEAATMWDDDTHPKRPHRREEAVTDRSGTQLVDVERDTPPIGVELGETNRDFMSTGLREFDDLTTGIDDLDTTL